MTTRNDIKNLMAFIGLAFPNFKPVLEGEINSVDVFYSLLGDIDLPALKTAVQACCAEAGRAFAPSAGEIRGMVVDLHMKAAGTPTAAEAWGAVMDSFRSTSFGRPELLGHPLVEKAVRCMGGLSTIGMSENNMADRAHFLKIYNELLERAQEDASELPIVAGYIETQRQEQIGAEIKQLAAKLDAKHA
jgi:hypothetical protein